MPNGLITPGLVLEIAEAGQDYVITPQELSDIMGTISSTVAGIFVFGFLGMVIGGLTKGLTKK